MGEKCPTSPLDVLGPYRRYYLNNDPCVDSCRSIDKSKSVAREFARSPSPFDDNHHLTQDDSYYITVIMKFSGPDLIVKSFEVDAVIVSKNVFSQEVLEQAAERLLAAWPSLSFRMKITVRFQKCIRLPCD